LVITMQNTEINSSTTLNLTVKTTDGDFPFTTKVTTRDYFTYAFVLSDVTGTITGFEFTPTNLDCTINLDEIAFMGEPIVKYDANTSDAVSGMPAGVYYDSELPTVLSDIVPVRTGYTFLGWAKSPDSKLLLSADTAVTAPTTFYAVWDKNDHWEFDTSSGIAVSNVDSGKTTYTDGILHYETTSSTDPIVTPSANFGYPVSSTSGKIEIRMKWTSTANMTSQIFFKTTTATALSEANSAKSGLSSFGQSVDDYQNVIVDFTSNSGWAGNLTYLRFDCTSYYGTADIDYIRFTNSEANIVTDAGQTRKVTSDWASYIVKEGGTLAPQGETALSALYLSGDVDMTNGYILLTGDYEIADSAEYAVFTLNMAEQNITAGSYMYLAGYDKPVTMIDGGKYLVKLDNGVGFVYFGNENDVSQKTVYKVTKSGAQLSENAFTATDTAVSVRVKEPVGVRFRAMVANRVIAATVENDGFAVKEFGFLVSTGSLMSDPVANLTMAAVDAGIAKKGINYGEDVSVFYGVTDENVIITAALVGIPETKAAYTTKLYVRPYMILDNGVVIYGTPITDTVYDIAYRLLDLVETGEEDYVDFVESVIAIVES
ncbi:MAG: InlB B-repeat-containing protein, partial [Eubacteriales bacterium]